MVQEAVIEQHELARLEEDAPRVCRIHVAPALGHGWVLETQNQHPADMARVREEYLWKAITGDADTGDDWDTYVAQWMRAGGEAVLAEARAQHAEM